LNRLRAAQEAELVYIRQQNELEVDKTREHAEIETSKFNEMVNAIGPSTLLAISNAGPDQQVCRICISPISVLI